MAPQETTAATPATTLIEHLGLKTKASAEVQDRAPRVPTADAA